MHALKAAAAARRSVRRSRRRGRPLVGSPSGQVAEPTVPCVLHAAATTGPSHGSAGLNAAVTWVVVGVLAAMVILMCGVGIWPSAPQTAGTERRRGAGDSRSDRDPPRSCSTCTRSHVGSRRTAADRAADAVHIGIPRPGRWQQSTRPQAVRQRPRRVYQTSRFGLRPTSPLGPSAAAGSPASLPDRATDSATTSRAGRRRSTRSSTSSRRPSYGIEGMMMAQEMRYQILTRMDDGHPPAGQDTSGDTDDRTSAVGCR